LYKGRPIEGIGRKRNLNRGQIFRAKKTTEIRRVLAALSRGHGKEITLEEIHAF
jgi:hypothetical protein